MADVITRLKLESGEFDSKIKRASQGLLQMEQECRKVGGTLAVLEQDQKQFVSSLGRMQTVSTTVRGKIGELSSAYVELASQYRRLTDEEKKGDFGRALSSSLSQLKTRIADSKKELADIGRELSGSKFGQFGSVIDSIGQKMGLNANITELLTSKTGMLTAGIGASVAIIGKATDQWVKYNSELAKQDQITRVTTGLKGTSATGMTDVARAIVDTYGVDFRETINAANTLMSQFGETGSDAMRIIKDGMQGMINGDGQKLLQMIQQYAPAFRDAGVSASQLVAVIQNSEGGIFTDQNMNAIVMGIKNIRLMSKQTSEALQKLGIDGEKMSKQLSDGTLTVFDALKQVASKLKDVNSNSQAAGEVMQTVFGRQGVTAGTNLAKAIETLNTNLEETKKQTGEVGNAYADLEAANERLNRAIRECFGYDGWQQMATGIKTQLVTALATVFDYLNKIKTLLNNGISVPGASPGVQQKELDKQLGFLKATPEDNRQKRYDEQMSIYAQQEQEAWKRYNNLRGNFQPIQSVWANSYNDTMMKRIDAAKQEALSWKQMAANYQQAAQSILNPNPPSTSSSGGGGTVGGGGSTGGRSGGGVDAATQAVRAVATANEDYARSIEKAALEVDAGRITKADQKKQEYQATLRLWEAYKKAADTTGNPQYLQQQEDLAKAVKTLGDQVTEGEAAQKAQNEATKELAAKQKAAADALNDMGNAMQSNDLKAYYAARKKQGDTGFNGTDAVSFSLTENNIDAFISNLKERLASEDIGSAVFNNLNAQLIDANLLKGSIELAVQNGIDTAQFDPQGLWNKIFGDNPGDYIDESKWEELRAQMEEVLGKPINIGGIKESTSDAKNSADAWRDAAGAIKSVSTAMQSINDPSAKIIGIIGEAIANIALAFSKADLKAGAEGNIWYWIGATAAGLATMVSTISSIKTVAKHAQGGIIQGNSYSGDNLVMPGPDGFHGLNAGEVVLNAAQSNSVASMLTAPAWGNMQLDTVIEAEGIRLVMNNNGYRRRKGGETYTRVR